MLNNMKVEGAYFYYVSIKGGRGVSKLSTFFYKGGGGVYELST